MLSAPIGALSMRRTSSGSTCGDFAGIGIDGLGGLVLLRPDFGAAAAGGLLEPVAVAIHGQNVDVVDQPVEQRAGEPLRPQHLRPVLEWQVRGDDDRAAFVALREGLEQQLGTGRRQRHIAKLVDDQQPHSAKFALQLEQATFVAGFQQLVDQRRRW
jgi:hypothetical protein